MARLIRTSLLLATATLFAACNNAGQETSSSTSATASAGAVDGRTQYERADDHAIGSPDAPVTVVEFASVSCGACANWHQTVYPEFKRKYVDTGKVRYVFREFLAGEPSMAHAGFMIALCAPEERYFENIGLQFNRQAQMFEFARRGELREAYVNLAKSSGLTEEEFLTCMQDEELREDYMERMQTGVDAGISGTPGFIINGQVRRVFTLESIEEVILPLLGEEAPVEDAADDMTEETAASTDEPTE